MTEWILRLIEQGGYWGIAFLMFIVGLEIDLKKLVNSGRIGAMVGTIQVVACAVLTVLFAVLLGFGGLPALYLGVATAFTRSHCVCQRAPPCALSPAAGNSRASCSSIETCGG